MTPENGRGGEIRTHDLVYPKHARYQATLRPDYQAVNSAPAPGVWQTILESELFDAGVADLDVVAAAAQVLVVTHSPQVAARAEAHWRIAKAGGADHVRTAVEVLSPADREEEIARMLAGAQITDAARAAARALMDA